MSFKISDVEKIADSLICDSPWVITKIDISYETGLGLRGVSDTAKPLIMEGRQRATFVVSLIHASPCPEKMVFTANSDLTLTSMSWGQTGAVTELTVAGEINL